MSINSMISPKKVMRIFAFLIAFNIPSMYGFSGFLYIDIKGEVLSKPCTINNGQTIEIDFGDVMTTRVQDEVYKEPIEYTVSCKDGVKPKLNIFIDGISSSFDQRLLKTSIDNLAVLFKADSTDFPLRSKRSFNFANPAKLDAVLVKKSGSDLPAKSFTATATLKVEYQ
ncbi:fimbrial protein [Providencia vermicola]|uniref:fimbrial protein n=1 Tax=Providencia vermicola TaxID=333965 RepID=UPI0021FF04C5|nr:fimbrial protein [Providencia stuartii]